MTPPRILLIPSPIACILLPPLHRRTRVSLTWESITLVPQIIAAWELFLSRIPSITLGKLGIQALQRSCNDKLRHMMFTMEEEHWIYFVAVFKEYAFLQELLLFTYIYLTGCLNETWIITLCSSNPRTVEFHLLWNESVGAGYVTGTRISRYALYSKKVQIDKALRSKKRTALQSAALWSRMHKSEKDCTVVKAV